jgi:hypothetical protein
MLLFVIAMTGHLVLENVRNFVVLFKPLNKIEYRLKFGTKNLPEIKKIHSILLT